MRRIGVKNDLPELLLLFKPNGKDEMSSIYVYPDGFLIPEQIRTWIKSIVDGTAQPIRFVRKQRWALWRYTILPCSLVRRSSTSPSNWDANSYPLVEFNYNTLREQVALGAPLLIDFTAPCTLALPASTPSLILTLCYFSLDCGFCKRMWPRAYSITLQIYVLLILLTHRSVFLCRLQETWRTFHWSRGADRILWLSAQQSSSD